MKRVLFVCTGNICRSPMAEAFFIHLAEQNGLSIRAGSAGLNVVLDSATGEAAIAAREYGVELSSHRSRRLSEAMTERADLILTMTEQHKRAVKRSFSGAQSKTFTLLEFAGQNGDIADPYGCPLTVYRRCAEQIWTAVEQVIERLMRDATGP